MGRENWVESAAVAAVLAAGLIIRAQIALDDLERVIQFVPDDAFYLFLGEDRCPTEMRFVDTIDRPGTSWNGAEINIYDLD